MNRRAALAAMLALAVAGLSSGACDRRPRFVTRDADSTAMAADSFEVIVQRARDAWDAAERPTAADLTARLLLEDLRARAEGSLAARARTFLDSLGFGGEVVGGREVAAVNLFATADPGSGSWPWLFWRREGAGTFRQRIEGSGMSLTDLSWDPGSDRSDGTEGPPRVALLFSRTAGAGPQPLVFVWRLGTTGEWAMVQSLGADSLGGTGTAKFDRIGDSRGVLVTRTWQNAPGFSECATCPHIFINRRFEWGDDGLRSTGRQVEPSAYSAFVDFLGAIERGDRETAERLVDEPSLVDAAMAYDWHLPRGQWRVAPGTSASATEIVFFRGNQEAYRVRFASRGGWRIEGFDPTSRSIE
jgi:hypothetical protein